MHWKNLDKKMEDRIDKKDPFLRRAIFEAYGEKFKCGDEWQYAGKCRYCGRTLRQDEMEIDHILASNFHRSNDGKLNMYLAQLSQKGFDLDKPDYIENYFPSCKPCNQKKTNHVPDEISLRSYHDDAMRHTDKVLKLLQKYTPDRTWDDD